MSMTTGDQPRGIGSEDHQPRASAAIRSDVIVSLELALPLPPPQATRESEVARAVAPPSKRSEVFRIEGDVM